jgi:NAD(P)-dependent dehydrogenase (short-subunit alcohol dehydrogenase family)
MKTFENLTVVVTGSARGFGRRTAERFYEGGANLVLSDLAAAPGDTVAGFDPDRIAYLGGDVADEAHHEALVALASERFGGLDIAVNNAGIVHDAAPLPMIPSEAARRVIEVDLLGVFFALKHQIPEMVKRSRSEGLTGAIVNIASVAGIGGAPTLSAYAAAKHGVVGLTRSAAAECARHGIRINAICPSFARTDMALSALKASPKEPEAAEAEMVRGVPMRRLAEIDEVVEAILFAASPANGFMTGQAIAIDGGITAL